MVLVTHDRFSLVLGSRKLPKNCNLAVSDIVWVATFIASPVEEKLANINWIFIFIPTKYIEVLLSL
ncbi:unnamed protein product, partial [Vitis vinifera]|uniref:Uncharacterized protein n=1 Tax=Vitis vinifera TaxID=29760 RepID=D7TJL5_VITVI